MHCLICLRQSVLGGGGLVFCFVLFFKEKSLCTTNKKHKHLRRSLEFVHKVRATTTLVMERQDDECSRASSDSANLRAFHSGGGGEKKGPKT